MQEMAGQLRLQGPPWTEDGHMGVRPFESFYEAERDGLFGALVLITGDRHEAEEITQDAFVAIWERWDRVAGMESPTGYLYRTAMNGFRKRRRRAALAVRRALHVAEPPEDLFAQADARPNSTFSGTLIAATHNVSLIAASESGSLSARQ